MHMYCSMVRISDVCRDDEGTYEVCAANREGEATNALVLNVTEPAAVVSEKKPKKKKTVKIKTPPEVIKPLTPTVCRLGDSVTLQATITGSPTPTVTWLLDGQPLSGPQISDRGEEGLHSVTIGMATQADDGVYTLRAENEAGSAQTSANLCVQGEFPQWRLRKGSPNSFI